MRLIAIVLGLACVGLAVIYFTMPADQLPAFLPGHEAGVMRIHTKHGAIAAAGGIVLLAMGWMMGRRAAA
jgi:cell division protein FtsW (lipid II flippase)